MKFPLKLVSVSLHHCTPLSNRFYKVNKTKNTSRNIRKNKFISIGVKPQHEMCPSATQTRDVFKCSPNTLHVFVTIPCVENSICRNKFRSLVTKPFCIKTIVTIYRPLVHPNYIFRTPGDHTASI